MSRTERDLAKIGIDLRAFLIDASREGRTQAWCAHQLHVSRKTISEHVHDYGIEWGHNAMKRRHGFEWRGVFDGARPLREDRRRLKNSEQSAQTDGRGLPGYSGSLCSLN